MAFSTRSLFVYAVYYATQSFGLLALSVLKAHQHSLHRLLTCEQFRDEPFSSFTNHRIGGKLFCCYFDNEVIHPSFFI